MMKKPSARPTSTEIWAYISKQVDGVLLNKYTSNNTVPWTPFELKNAEAEIFALEGYKKLEQYKGIKTSEYPRTHTRTHTCSTQFRIMPHHVALLHHSAFCSACCIRMALCTR